VEQLSEGGRMIVPVGQTRQELLILEKREGAVRRETLMSVRFVRMTGGRENRQDAS
jgi:protein-L-isoaspartate(D-aspartate) O-methyltransferase